MSSHNILDVGQRNTQDSLKAVLEEVKIEKSETQSYAVIITAKQNHVHVAQL